MNARIERLKELLKQSPSDSFIRFALAKEMEKIGEVDQALQILNDLLVEKPNYIGAYYHLADLLKGKEDYEKALIIYDTGMKMAKMEGDQHAFSELQNAKMNLEIELG